MKRDIYPKSFSVMSGYEHLNFINLKDVHKLKPNYYM